MDVVTFYSLNIRKRENNMFKDCVTILLCELLPVHESEYNVVL